MRQGKTDSRDYIIPFTILEVTDIPSDFDVPPELPEECSGIFLPQESSRFGLHRCPPRVLVAAQSVIWILTRRNSGSVRVPLAQWESMECGRILLLGWIGFYWNGSGQVLPYNRRGAVTVEKFLNRLKLQWLAETGGLARPQSFGGEPDTKFRYAQAAELLRDEKPCVQCFHPSACRMERHFGFRRQTRLAGDLLVLSNRRLLWITDRYRAGREPYGTVSRSTPLSAIAEIRTSYEDAAIGVQVALRSGAVWRIPFDAGQEEVAQAFAEASTRLLAGKTYEMAPPTYVARTPGAELPAE